MQKKTWLLLGAGAVALYLLTKKKAAAAPVAAKPGVKGYLGQVPYQAWGWQAAGAAAPAAATPAVTCPAGTIWNGSTCVYTGTPQYYQQPYYGGYQTPYGYGYQQQYGYSPYGYQQPYGYNYGYQAPAYTEYQWATGQAYPSAPVPVVENV